MCTDNELIYWRIDHVAQSGYYNMNRKINNNGRRVVFGSGVWYSVHSGISPSTTSRYQLHTFFLLSLYLGE